MLTQIALKGRSSGVILVVASQFAKRWYYPEYRESRTIEQNSSRLCLLNWCEWSSQHDPALGLGHARQFEGFVYVDGLGRERDSALGKLADILNGADL